MVNGTPAANTQSEISNVIKDTGLGSLTNAQATGARVGNVGFVKDGVDGGFPADAQRGGAKNN